MSEHVAPVASPVPPEERLRLLREELARLEAELGEAPEPRPARHGGWWRGGLVVVCLTLLALLAPLAIVATWAHDEVSDTERYVETVSPLADDPAVQRAVSDRITAELLDRLDVQAVTEEAAAALVERGVSPTAATTIQALATPLANGIENFVGDQVTRVVESDRFATAWEEVNRAAHGQMVAVLTGDTGTVVQAEGDTVLLNLGVLIDEVKARLLDAGFTLADRIPSADLEIALFQSAELARAQDAFRVLSALARALPVVALVLLGTALLVTRRRRRVLIAGSLVVAGSMLALGLVLNAFRVIYLDAVPPERLPADAAAAVYDQLVSFIRLNLRAVLVLFLAVAAVAWVTGPAPVARSVREAGSRARDAVRSRSDSAGLGTGRVGEFLGRYRGPLRALVVGAVVVVYLLEDHPTGAWTAGVLGVAAVVLLVIELLAREPVTTPDPVAAPPGPPRVE